MDISIRLAELIEATGDNPVWFAEKLGIHRSSISHLLSGRNKPGVEFFEKLLAVYPDTDLGWLISGREKSAPAGPSADREQTVVVPEKPSAQPVSSSKNQREPVRVILFYADGSFESFDSSAS